MSELLLERSCPIHCFAKNDGSTALHEAATSGHWSVVDLLLKRAAQAEALNKRKDTALHIAARNADCDGHRLVSQKLIGVMGAVDWDKYAAQDEVQDEVTDAGTENDAAKQDDAQA